MARWGDTPQPPGRGAPLHPRREGPAGTSPAPRQGNASAPGEGDRLGSPPTPPGRGTPLPTGERGRLGSLLHAPPAGMLPYPLGERRGTAPGRAAPLLPGAAGRNSLVGALPCSPRVWPSLSWRRPSSGGRSSGPGAPRRRRSWATCRPTVVATRTYGRPCLVLNSRCWRLPVAVTCVKATPVSAHAEPSAESCSFASSVGWCRSPCPPPRAALAARRPRRR